MMWGNRHVVEVLLNPLCLFLIVYAVLLIKLWRRPGSSGRIEFSLLFLMLFLVSLGWLPRLMTGYLERQYPVVTALNHKVHWVVVFSGGQVEEGKKPAHLLLNNASIKRLLEGIRLYRQLPNAQLLLSGGGYGNEMAESTRMAQLAAWFSLPAKPILLETASLNTAQQAKKIKQWVHEEPFYLVTSAIHLPRAMALCRSQGLHPIAAPADLTLYWQDERWDKFYLPNAQNLVYLSIALHEYLGMAWAKWLRDIT